MAKKNDKTAQEQIKEEWGNLLTELHAALSPGQEEHPRKVVSILSDIERVRLEPEAKGLGLIRPCTYLDEWQFVALPGSISVLEQERRQWVDKGWLPATEFDECRYKDKADADRKAKFEERQLTERLQKNAAEFNRKVVPLRLKG